MGLSPVTFYDLRYDQNNRSPIIFLKDTQSDRFLPVWIGEAEAISIEIASRGETPPRPLTHDLMKRILDNAGIRLVSVIIDRLVGSVYYATLVLEVGERTVEVDCRPSDGVALALREKAQIFVSDELMYNIKFVEMSPAEGMALEEADEPEATRYRTIDFKQFLKGVKPSDFKEG
ncbi:MAG: hypothetical protein B1H03_03450 [Planctomycetales bacterium 4484_113]|nr:MAG: hypothetical protein B1H03_03450 [Planctomycetales bacterium 4484_113]